MRVGPKMREAVEYVRHNPGCNMHEVSLAVGPHGSNAYGWRTVKRAMAAGLIVNRPAEVKPGAAYALHVTDTKR